MRPAFLPGAGGRDESPFGPRLRTIVVLADLSEASSAALDRAADLAAAHDASLRVLPLADDPAGEPLEDPMPRLRWRVRRVARRHARPIAVEEAPLTLRDALRGPLREADLVVTHPRPGRGLAAAWRGDTTAGIAARLSQPLLVVRVPCRPYPGVLAAVELDDQPDRVGRWACTLAGEVPVTLLHVVQVLGPGALRRSDAAPGARSDARVTQTLAARSAELRRVALALAAGGDRVEHALAVGRGVVDELLARRPEGGLVVVGRSNESPWLDAVFGSVPRALLRDGDHDLLIVPVRANLRCAEAVAATEPGAETRDGTGG